MKIYTIDIPGCPMTMEAPDTDTAVRRCEELGLDPAWLREAYLPEARQHAEIQKAMSKATDHRAESKREGREL